MLSSEFKFRNLFLIFGLAVALGLTGCASGEKEGDDSDSVEQADQSSTDANEMGDSDSGNASGLQSINFPFDSFELSDSARSILQANAQILKDNSGVRIQIEGHCDERGGIQYNIALGEKRANAVKRFMENEHGISGDRITTISYGKERPLVDESSESAWAKNRRANFVITARE